MITTLDVVPQSSAVKTNSSSLHPIVITALNYISEAVQKERYEEISAMAKIAFEFGMDASHLRTLFNR